MSRFMFVVILFLVNSTIQTAAQSAEVVITEVRDIAEVVGDFYNFDRVELSPDGQNIAWLDWEEGVCIYAFSEDETLCTHIPWVDRAHIEGTPTLWNLYLDWSPDSRYLTFAEYPFGGPVNYDSDVWIFDIETRDFVNATDDQIESYWMMDLPSMEVPPVLDYLSLWNPASNEVFYFRTAIAVNVAETGRFLEGLALWRVSLTSRTPEQVYAFDDRFHSIVYAASVSPDGTQLALFLVRYEEQYNIGIWVLDVTSGMLRQVVEQSAFQDTDLGWEQYWFPYGRNSILWLENPDALVIGSESRSQPMDADGLPTYVQNVHYVDLETGEVSALVDYDQADGERGAILHDKMPRLAVVCDDHLVYYVGRRRHATIYVVPLPFDGSAPVALATNQDYRLADHDSLFVTHNGRVLLDRRLVMDLECGE